jgi:drug/metabolite transporter (DMT)-like permease
VILGIFGIAAVQTSYYFTISVLNVSLAIFLQFLAPALITIYSVIFLNEKLTLPKAIALGLALGGSYFIIFGGGAGIGSIKLIGLITGLSSAVFSAFYTLYGKNCTSKYNPWTVLVYGLASGAVLYWFISPPWVVWSGRTGAELLQALYIALVATILPFGLYLCGIRYLIPTVAGVISMLEPVVASLSAFLILGESMTFTQILGATAVIGAIILLQSNAAKSNEETKNAQNKEVIVNEQI